jgi:cysteine desulfurase/selenocysteine lyase
MKDIKSQFPIFQSHPELVYFDNAASTQTPESVIQAMDNYYKNYRANIHRGLYDLSQKATEEYENGRAKIAQFINAKKEEVIFTSGTTHGLNLLARSLGKNLQPGDNIVLTRLEHHANLVPWQQIAKEKGVEIRFIDLNIEMNEIDGDDLVFANMQNKFPIAKFSGPFNLDTSSAQKLIDKNTKIVSFSLVSNVLGNITHANEIIDVAKQYGAITIVDAAQAIAHIPLDIKNLDCDFLVFSGHKMYGPTGIGVLYGKKDRLETLEPYFYGGDMVSTVTYQDAEWADTPARFEGGTPNIAGAIGLGVAVDFITSIGWNNLIEHEVRLTEKLFSELQKIEGVKIIGPEFGESRIGVVSFVLEGIHTHDVAEILNRDQVCIRGGHHCAMPLMQYLGLPGTNRVSVGIYNSVEDIDRLAVALEKVKKIFV